MGQCGFWGHVVSQQREQLSWYFERMDCDLGGSEAPIIEKYQQDISWGGLQAVQSFTAGISVAAYKQSMLITDADAMCHMCSLLWTFDVAHLSCSEAPRNEVLRNRPCCVNFVTADSSPRLPTGSCI